MLYQLSYFRKCNKYKTYYYGKLESHLPSDLRLEPATLSLVRNLGMGP